MKIKKLSFIVVLFLGIMLLSGCDSLTTTNSGESDPATYLVTGSEAEINRLVNYFKASYIELFDAVENGTDTDASKIKDEIKTLKNNIDKVDLELTSAVENSTITDEVKKGYDKELETLKTDLDDLNKRLES